MVRRENDRPKTTSPLSCLKVNTIDDPVGCCGIQILWNGSEGSHISCFWEIFVEILGNFSYSHRDF